jgi:ABC-type sulfate/molybdate transport systems ATPase subunit
MATLKLEIVTPEARIYSEDVDMVTLPGVEGEMGIFPMHIPLMTQVAHGEIVARKGGQEHFLAVGEGFVEITGDRVAILNHGQIEQVGTPDAVYDHPATPFVCGFLGETNRLPVEVHGGQAWIDDRPVYAASQTNVVGRADLFVRPQHLKLDRPDASPLAGVVELVRRHGAIRRAEIAIRGLARRLDVDIGSDVAPSRGERVGLRIVKGHLFAAS